MVKARTFPKIFIDDKKCTVPLLCKKCIQVCPMIVFRLRVAPGREERFKEIDPRIDGNFVLSAPRRDKCTACDECIEVCPVDAIKIDGRGSGRIVEAGDYFAELKKAPYPLFVSPRPYSFDLNEDMIKLIRDEFSAEDVVSKLAEAISGKAASEVEKMGKEIFEDYGQNWMRKTMQLGEEYPDRTIESVKETVDHSGIQFLLFPHVPQRFVEIAYLSTQRFLKLPIIFNNARELAYQVPQCLLFNTIKEKCGDEVANLMTCQNVCLKALETLGKDLELDLAINMEATTAKDAYCEFSMKKL